MYNPRSGGDKLPKKAEFPNDTLALRLRGLRIEKHVSQLKLSVELGFSQSIVAAYEAGRKNPSIFSLCCMADYFNCSTDYLLGRTDRRSKNV